MKNTNLKRIIIPVILILSLTLPLAACASAANAAATSGNSGKENVITVTAVTKGSPKPYVYFDDEGNPAGYDIEVLQEIFRRLPGYKLEIEKAIDIASILTGVTSGLFQIAVNNLSYNKERAASYLYSYPYNDIAYMFITGPDAQPIRTFEEAAGKSIEGSSGGAILTAIETWNEEHPDKKINIKYTEGDTSVGMLHVEDGTTDFMIIDVAMYNNYLKEFNYNVVATELSKEEAAHISNSTYTYFLLAQSDAELRDIIDEVLKKIKQDGTLAKINAKYFGGDYTPAADQYEKTLN